MLHENFRICSLALLDKSHHHSNLLLNSRKETFPYGATNFHSIWNNVVSNLPPWDILFCEQVVAPYGNLSYRSTHTIWSRSIITNYKNSALKICLLTNRWNNKGWKTVLHFFLRSSRWRNIHKQSRLESNVAYYCIHGLASPETHFYMHFLY